MQGAALRRGDLVEVRSAAEILQTLDEHGALESLPFMPEMVPYCGRQFVVDKRADKLCDTIRYWGCRRMPDTVLLADTRCDGKGHDGCQAECRLYWKEAWLKRVDGDAARSDLPLDPAATAALMARVTSQTSRPGPEGEPRRYRCQATQMLEASLQLGTNDPRPYLNELATGNVSLGDFARVMARAAVMQPLHKLRLLPDPPVRGNGRSSATAGALGLKAGDWVRVKSREEIASTLNDKGKNRGLWFDREMVPFCGGVFQVRQRISKLIDERDGRMIELRSDCVTLEGVVCTGELSVDRWFCPRAIFPYWRECWLERAAPPGS